MNFPCTGCGACCKRLPETSPMALADGRCRHLDLQTDRCSVYAQRPLVCRVDDFFHSRMADTIPARVYYLIQARSCVGLDAGNAELPRMMAEQLVDSQPIGSPDDGGAAPTREARIEAMMALRPDELERGVQHILAAVGELSPQEVECAVEAAARD